MLCRDYMRVFCCSVNAKYFRLLRGRSRSVVDPFTTVKYSTDRPITHYTASRQRQQRFLLSMICSFVLFDEMYDVFVTSVPGCIVVQ